MKARLKGGIFLILCQLTFVQAQDQAADLLETATGPNSENVPDFATTAGQAPSLLNTSLSSSPRLPYIFGMRVQLPADDPFGYDELGVCIVTPDSKFKVVIYGNHLDKIEEISFTRTNSCADPDVTIKAANNFVIHFQHKALFELTLPLLPETVHAYKMCVKPKMPPPGYEMKPQCPKSAKIVSGYGTWSNCLPENNSLEDYSTWITTEKPPKEYFLPLPLQICFLVFLLCLSALFSGLTLGLMSMTPQELELVQKSGSAQEQKYASAILPVRSKGNLLLCSLLLGNVIVNAAISILFGELTTGLLALVISSLGIVIFGEIVPQSICVKKGLAVGAHTIFITQFFIFVTFPIAYPISKLLDCLLGDEYVAYDRKRLMELMKMSMKDGGQMSNELKIAVGAMEIIDKVVSDVMTRINDVFMLPDNTVLNAKTIAEIVRMGYTRIPVYSGGDKNNITDMLYVKDLALLDPDDNFTVKTVCGYHQHPVKFVLADTPLSVILEAFKKGEGHLAMVKKLVSESAEKDPVYELVGIVTLEDIVEEILQAEIVDEFDVVTDNVTRVKRKITHHQAKDMTKFFDKEAPLIQISMHLQMVAMQWLAANTLAFSEKHISKEVLERLVKTSVRRVDISSLMAMYTNDASRPELNLPRLARLYNKDEMSDRFILILEGRVQVTIGQGGMMFEAGPWHSFGTEVLDKLTQGAATLSRSMSIVDSSDLSCRRPDLMFKPDFTVLVKDDCTYIEVSVANYINAYKSTLMQREKARDGSSMGGSRSPSPERRSKANSFKEPLILNPDNEIAPGRRQSHLDAKEALHELNRIEEVKRNAKKLSGTLEELTLLNPNSQKLERVSLAEQEDDDFEE